MITLRTATSTVANLNLPMDSTFTTLADIPNIASTFPRRAGIELVQI